MIGGRDAVLLRIGNCLDFCAGEHPSYEILKKLETHYIRYRKMTQFHMQLLASVEAEMKGEK